MSQEKKLILSWTLKNESFLREMEGRVYQQEKHVQKSRAKRKHSITKKWELRVLWEIGTK